MDEFYSDEDIALLISEVKSIPVSLAHIGAKFREKRGHKEFDYFINRPDGSLFIMKIRQSLENALAFSVILALQPKGKSELFILRRYNGKNHRHRNRIEKDIAFYDFHIHTATERYQNEGMYEEGYAVVTDRYVDLNGAIESLIADCNIVSTNPQKDLFV